jgi:hypothetical protein
MTTQYYILEEMWVEDFSTDHIKIGFISVSPGVHIMVPQNSPCWVYIRVSPGVHIMGPQTCFNQLTLQMRCVLRR